MSLEVLLENAESYIAAALEDARGHFAELRLAQELDTADFKAGGVVAMTRVEQNLLNVRKVLSELKSEATSANRAGAKQLAPQAQISALPTALPPAGGTPTSRALPQESSPIPNHSSAPKPDVPSPSHSQGVRMRQNSLEPEPPNWELPEVSRVQDAVAYDAQLDRAVPVDNPISPGSKKLADTTPLSIDHQMPNSDLNADKAGREFKSENRTPSNAISTLTFSPNLDEQRTGSASGEDKKWDKLGDASAAIKEELDRARARFARLLAMSGEVDEAAPGEIATATPVVEVRETPVPSAPIEARDLADQLLHMSPEEAEKPLASTTTKTDLSFAASLRQATERLEQTFHTMAEVQPPKAQASSKEELLSSLEKLKEPQQEILSESNSRSDAEPLKNALKTETITAPRAIETKPVSAAKSAKMDAWGDYQQMPQPTAPPAEDQHLHRTNAMKEPHVHDTHINVGKGTKAPVPESKPKAAAQIDTKPKQAAPETSADEIPKKVSELKNRFQQQKDGSEAAEPLGQIKSPSASTRSEAAIKIGNIKPSNEESKVAVTSTPTKDHAEVDTIPDMDLYSAQRVESPATRSKPSRVTDSHDEADNRDLGSLPVTTTPNPEEDLAANPRPEPPELDLPPASEDDDDHDMVFINASLRGTQQSLPAPEEILDDQMYSYYGALPDVTSKKAADGLDMYSSNRTKRSGVKAPGELQERADDMVPQQKDIFSSSKGRPDKPVHVVSAEPEPLSSEGSTQPSVPQSRAVAAVQAAAVVKPAVPEPQEWTPEQIAEADALRSRPQHPDFDRITALPPMDYLTLTPPTLPSEVIFARSQPRAMATAHLRSGVFAAVNAPTKIPTGRHPNQMQMHTQQMMQHPHHQAQQQQQQQSQQLQARHSMQRSHTFGAVQAGFHGQGQQGINPQMYSPANSKPAGSQNFNRQNSLDASSMGMGSRPPSQVMAGPSFTSPRTASGSGQVVMMMNAGGSQRQLY